MATLVDQIQVQPGKEGVGGPEATGQRLGKRGDLDPHPPLGQLSELDGVTPTGDQRLQHRPPGHPGDVGSNRGQLDPRVLQQLFQALDLPRTLSHPRGPGAGEITQLPDRLKGNERAAHQPMGTELGQPRRVGDVGLAAGQILHMPGVDEHHVQVVLEQVVERLPVVAGGLHHYQRDVLADPMLPQRPAPGW